jgi:hypothetical protein
MVERIKMEEDKQLGETAKYRHQTYIFSLLQLIHLVRIGLRYVKMGHELKTGGYETILSICSIYIKPSRIVTIYQLYEILQVSPNYIFHLFNTSLLNP